LSEKIRSSGTTAITNLFIFGANFGIPVRMILQLPHVISYTLLLCSNFFERHTNTNTHSHTISAIQTQQQQSAPRKFLYIDNH